MSWQFLAIWRVWHICCNAECFHWYSLAVYCIPNTLVQLPWLSANRDLKQEVRTQVTRAARISGCLCNLIWRNKYMSTESTVRIYKTIVRPVLTYASETRAETTYTQQLLRTIEMKTIRAIHGKTLRDKIRSDQLRQLSGIQDVIKWTNVRRKEWDAHVERVEDNRLAKIARGNRPQGVRSRGRPKKRWKESLNAAPWP